MNTNETTNTTTPVEGSLRFYWIPQVPMNAFKVPVKTVDEAKLLYATLADYDLFQYENKLKPDYCNMGGLEVFHNGEWEEWRDEETDYSIDELMP